MTDESTQEPTGSESDPVQPPSEIAGHGEVDIDALLSEFDQAEGNGATAPDQGPQDGLESDGVPILDDGTLARLDSLEGFAMHVQERDARQAAAQAFDRMIAAGEAELGDNLASLPTGYVGRYINSEMAVNAALADAWDAVYAPGSIPTQADVNRLNSELTSIGKALLAEVEATAARQYDRDTTADRFAVSAAVKGASTRAVDTSGPSVREISSWPQDKQDQHARDISRQYAGR